MVYKAYIKQAGEGCDYTIGCAQTVLHLNANTMSDAIKEVEELMDENYFDDQSLEKCEIYEINEVRELDTSDFYSKRSERLATKKAEADRIKRFNEYQKLKDEFEGKDIE